MPKPHFKLGQRGTQWALAALCGLTMTACATRQPTVPSLPVVASPTPPPVVSCEDPQREIARLQQLLELIDSLIYNNAADKEAAISTLRARQQNQNKLLQETTSQAARAEVKLRRFATESDAASLLAEVEVAMAQLRAMPGAEQFNTQKMQAQRILDSASNAFLQGDYGLSLELATQARQFIDMLAGLPMSSGADRRMTSEVPFTVAINVRMKVDGNLRRRPRSNAAVLGVLQKATPIFARAYQGQWLWVQTEHGDSGWVLSSLVEAR